MNIDKYEFTEFSKQQVVHEEGSKTEESLETKFIEHAISKHFEQISKNNSQEKEDKNDSRQTSTNIDAAPTTDNDVPQEAQEIEDNEVNHEEPNKTNGEEGKKEHEEPLDTPEEDNRPLEEQDKEEANSSEAATGKADASKIEEYEARIKALELDKEWLDKLNYNLEQFKVADYIKNEIADELVEISVIIAEKIHIIMPADFKKILHDELLTLVDQSYKHGEIVVKIHPSRYEFCKKLLAENELPSKIIDNCVIVSDEKIEHNDCMVEFSGAKIEFNREQLIEDITDTIKNTLNSTK